ncbi:MAG: heme ABC exporter ATP-binding protein CcmA [Gemmatimonadota bacterium]
MPPSPAVLTRRLCKRFGWRWALRDVDLIVERGTSVTLVGPNGAGKTTLLRILATLVKPSRGEVEVFGHPVGPEGDAIRSRVGLLTATGYLYDELTGAENLRFAILMGGQRPDGSRILQALERVGLADAADVRVRGYSAGMRKRLELARLLLRRLDLLLMDEPYASLDAKGIRLVDQVISQARTDGATVVLASHQRGEAVLGADRLVVLSGGRISAEGPPAEVLDAARLRPAEGL